MPAQTVSHRTVVTLCRLVNGMLPALDIVPVYQRESSVCATFPAARPNSGFGGFIYALFVWLLVRTVLTWRLCVGLGFAMVRCLLFLALFVVEFDSYHD